MGKRGQEEERRRRWRLALVAGTAVFAVGAIAVSTTLLLPEGDREAVPGEAVYRWQPHVRLDPRTSLPAFAAADPQVARLYRFALARPDLLNYIPCTCGCDQLGHHSNWNCYIQHVTPDGSVVFDDMAPG